MVSGRWSVAMWRCACLLALLCAALTRVGAVKRAEMSPVPFVLGSRYGRSPGLFIAPRDDRRFFMGSRYGKRSQAAGGAGVVGPCDCAHYRHAQPRLFFNRKLNEERVIED